MCASIAYADGSNPVTVLAFRTEVALAVLLLVLRIRGVPVGLPPRDRIRALGLGLLLSLYSFGLLGSIYFVPLALGVITFYTHPLWVALGAWATGQDRISPWTALALIGAFAGLWLALDITGGDVDPVGIGLALLGAMTFAVLLLVSNRVRGSGDSRPITAHMLTAALAVYVVAALGFDALAWPQTLPGQVAILAGAFTYTFSIVMLFVGISMIGPVRATLVLYVEPMASAVFGYVLLGESLDASQIGGIALVIASLLVARR